eukprot:1195750-Prorocentrum_minimum.AAC.1
MSFRWHASMCLPAAVGGRNSYIVVNFVESIAVCVIACVHYRCLDEESQYSLRKYLALWVRSQWTQGRRALSENLGAPSREGTKFDKVVDCITQNSAEGVYRADDRHYKQLLTITKEAGYK